MLCSMVKEQRDLFAFNWCALIRVLNVSALVLLCGEGGVHCSHTVLAVATFFI